MSLELLLILFYIELILIFVFQSSLVFKMYNCSTRFAVHSGETPPLKFQADTLYIRLNK